MRRKPKPVEYLSVEEVISLHAFVLGASQEKAEHYLQSRDRLLSAMDRPINAAHYANADIYRQAATFLWGLVLSHGFIDGNKRVAWVATREFLVINGYTLIASVDERAELVVGIAEHDYDEEATDEWMRQHIVPIKEQSASE